MTHQQQTTELCIIKFEVQQLEEFMNIQAELESISRKPSQYPIIVKGIDKKEVIKD